MVQYGLYDVVQMKREGEIISMKQKLTIDKLIETAMVCDGANMEL